MTSILNRTIVVLKLPINVTALVKVGENVVTAMQGNAAFPSPSPSLATVAALLAKLNTAERATATRAKGTVPARNSARVDVVQALHALKAYVQTVADASPDDAATIIAGASMSPKKPPVRTKVPFTAIAGPTTGTVKLVVKAAARRASYEWQWSADGGKTWTLAPATLQARTTLTGLPVGTNVLFRFRPVTKTGEADWSQAISFLVK